MLELIADKRERRYELTFLIPTSLTSTEITQVEDAITNVTKKHALSIVSQDDWGKKELAYPIKKSGKRHSQAFYRHWVVSGDASQIQAFEQDLYLQQDLLRHLLVLAETASAGETPAISA